MHAACGSINRVMAQDTEFLRVCIHGLRYVTAGLRDSMGRVFWQCLASQSMATHWRC